MKKSKFEISKVYTIRWKKYKYWKIRICYKDSIHFPHQNLRQIGQGVHEIGHLTIKETNRQTEVTTLYAVLPSSDETFQTVFFHYFLLGKTAQSIWKLVWFSLPLINDIQETKDPLQLRSKSFRSAEKSHFMWLTLNRNAWNNVE